MKKAPIHKTNRIKSFIQEYRVEVISILVVGLGIFLLVERLEIRKTVLAWARSVLQWIYRVFTNLFEGVIGYFNNFTLSDFVGLVMILLSISFFLWRIRVRLLKHLHWFERTCPRCKNDVHRIHRNWLDRLWGFLLRRPLHRYYCSNPSCTWTGLRYGAHLHQQNGKTDTH